MFTATIFLSILISLALSFLVMYIPLYRTVDKPYFTPESDQGEFDEKLSLLEAISELETDFKMDKLSKEDYEMLSNEYKRNYLEKKKSVKDKALESKI